MNQVNDAITKTTKVRKNKQKICKNIIVGITLPNLEVLISGLRPSSYIEWTRHTAILTKYSHNTLSIHLQNNNGKNKIYVIRMTLQPAFPWVMLLLLLVQWRFLI